MKPRSAKNKGQRFVKEVAQEICTSLNIDPSEMRVTPSGVPGVDLWLSPAAQREFPFAVECKNQETLNIWAAIAQATANALGTGLLPLLLFRRNRSETYVALHFDDFIKIIQKLNMKGGYNCGWKKKHYEEETIKEKVMIDPSS